jgi:ribosomal-protein-alanine N-acetyltransferase
MDLSDLPLAVEPMRLVHIPAIMEIERASFTLPWPESAYHYELTQNELAHYYVLGPRLSSSSPVRPTGWRRLWRMLRLSRDPDAADSSPIVWGYGGFWLMYDEAHISTLGVRPEWRGRGWGELLLLTMLEEAHRLRSRVATLEVRVSNMPAQSLYLKYRFEQVGRRKGYYADNREDALIMTTPALAAPDYLALMAARRGDLLRRLAETSSRQKLANAIKS